AVLDLPVLREGKSPLRCVIAEDATIVRGYARYSTKRDWSTDAATVYVREVIAADAAALAALYRYLFDLDLMTVTELWNVPVDDPVLHWLRNVRAAKPRLHDAVYVRLVDVRRALAERRYAQEVDTIIEVEDSECPWNAGLWRLVAGRDGASCEPAAAGSEPDLSIPVTDLGAVYLGGTTLHELAAAGRVRELRDGALRAASAAFSWTPAPWCPVVF
ncbi:MAG: sterol carrier protein domain-containing protein, partial [Chloroflexota bacterium]|nr:sterol carrier protein domain-containing protein [Chloroflexota bacterium]